MPIKKLDDADLDKLWTPGAVCRHPEHDVPSMIALPPGRYEHTCPACGKSKVFRVGAVSLAAR